MCRVCWVCAYPSPGAVACVPQEDDHAGVAGDADDQGDHVGQADSVGQEHFASQRRPDGAAVGGQSVDIAEVHQAVKHGERYAQQQRYWNDN